MTKQINLLRWLRTMFRGRGRMHLDSGILVRGPRHSEDPFLLA